MKKCVETFQPSAIVLQCGADSVTGDRLGCFNLSLRGHASCVDFVRNLHIPMLVLGGGGYTIKNVSRTWSYETSVLLQKEIDNNIPYNNFIEWYAPTYQLHLIPSNMENKNTQEYLDNLMWLLRRSVTCRQDVTEHLRSIEGAPSVPIQDVPAIWNKEKKEEEEDPEKREDGR